MGKQRLKGVDDAAVLHDFPVFDSVDVDAVKAQVLAGGWNPHPVVQMGSLHHTFRDDSISVAVLPDDPHAAIWAELPHPKKILAHPVNAGRD